MSKTLESKLDWRAFWNSITQRVARDDLMGQVGRTVMGRPIAGDQIDLVAMTIVDGLELGPEDLLIDLCCGNGVITERLAEHCSSAFGVDYSGPLIEVARRRSSGKVRYFEAAAEDIAELGLPAVPAKISLNQGAQHMSKASLDAVVQAISRHLDVDRIVLTDVPDRARVFALYDTPERRAEYLRRRRAGNEAIGTWWDRTGLEAIFQAHGYDAISLDVEAERYTSRYRFDLLAVRRQ
jgi:SAM-dependent methyltransferase